LKGIHRFQGFTAIDLSIAVAVSAIVLAVALPSYRATMEKRQVTSSAEQLAAFLGSAKAAAVKHNQFVVVKYQALADGWCFGMKADHDPSASCDCTVMDVAAENACTIDGAIRTLPSSALNHPETLHTASVGGSGTVVFNPIRGLTEQAETVNLELASDDASYALDVEISVIGRVKICSNRAAPISIPGYDICST
jgi:Tfp pilus assembly protein FimT